jgi:hypothetical protein
MEAPSGYPVQVTFEPPPANNRLWAVPLVGFLVKTVILIPHLVALAVLMTVATVSQLVLWIPVFTRGQYPAWGYTLVGGTMRVEAYFLGLTDRYPPFSLDNENGAIDSYPISVTIPCQPKYNRAWAILLAGLPAKAVLLIPHFFILRILEMVTSTLQLVLWVPVLFRGQYPTWDYQLVLLR